MRDVDYLIFGKTVTIGRGRYTLPKLKLADVLALGPEPFSPARVWLEPDGDDQMEFVIVTEAEPTIEDRYLEHLGGHGGPRG